MNRNIIIVDEEDAGTRLDKFLATKLPQFSRSRIQALLEQGMVTLGSLIITDGAQKVKQGQHFELIEPAAIPTHMLPESIALDIIYEDKDLLVLNKQAGLTVHPAPGHRDGTLVNALLAHCGESLSGIGGVTRPGIVHRIDKDTSGLMVVAKNDAAHNALSAQLVDRSLSRTYNAICWGAPKVAKGTIIGSIGRSPVNRQKMAVVKTGGKPATTHYTMLSNYGFASLIECKLETGRTHQIRVHMLQLGHPLIGDPVYGSATSQRLKSSAFKLLDEETRTLLLTFDRQALHAIRMAFIHPRTNKKMEFAAPLPDDMQQLIAALAKT